MAANLKVHSFNEAGKARIMPTWTQHFVASVPGLYARPRLASISVSIPMSTVSLSSVYVMMTLWQCVVVHSCVYKENRWGGDHGALGGSKHLLTIY